MIDRMALVGLVCGVFVLAGCAAEAVGPGGEHETEEMDAAHWSDWAEVAPGISQRASDRGGMQTEVRGLEGHRWLVEKLGREREDLSAHVERAAPDEIDGLRVRLQENDDLLAQAEAQVAASSLTQGIEGAPAIYKQADTYDVMAGPCTMRAYAYHYHTGMVDALGRGTCPAAQGFGAGAVVCVGGQCSYGPIDGGLSPDQTTQWRQNYAVLPCQSEATYFARGTVIGAGVTLIAEVAGTCFTFD
ncbi:hypothetical protein [Polyangium sp. y55x31]|uniref:hypothetical protein n=1 Tax=Polyangium sp. y55x31 TaxID=3042688 RepID=UPI002482E361|nr:hypothetical protein [Polyangium sp. y55x31]MDI1476936.1 hypothetical protein [Polyangium sp. y55x31]